MTAIHPVPLLELDPDVHCAGSCGRPAQFEVELDATTDGTPVAELLCEPCTNDVEAV